MLSLVSSVLLAFAPTSEPNWQWTHGFGTLKDFAANDRTVVSWTGADRVWVNDVDGITHGYRLQTDQIKAAFVADSGRVALIYKFFHQQKIGLFDPEINGFVWTAPTASDTFTPCRNLRSLGTAEGVYDIEDGAFTPTRPGTIYVPRSLYGFVPGPTAITKYLISTNQTTANIKNKPGTLIAIGNYGDRFLWETKLGEDGYVTAYDKSGNQIYQRKGDAYSVESGYGTYAFLPSASLNVFRLTEEKITYGEEGTDEEEDPGTEDTVIRDVIHYRIADGLQIARRTNDLANETSTLSLVSGWRNERVVENFPDRREILDSSGNVLRKVSNPLYPLPAVYSPNGSFLLAGNGWKTGLVAIDTATGNRTGTPLSTSFDSFGWTPQGNLWAYGNGHYVEFDGNGNVQTKYILKPFSPIQVARFPNGTLVSRYYNGSVRVYAPGSSDGQLVALPTLQEWHRLSLSPLGDRFAIGGYSVSLPSLAVTQVAQNGTVVYGATNGNYLVGENGRSRVYDKAGKLLKTILWGGAGLNTSPAISPDGKTVALVNTYSIRLYLAKTEALIAAYDTHLPEIGFIDAISFSPDSQKLAIMGAEGILRQISVSDANTAP